MEAAAAWQTPGSVGTVTSVHRASGGPTAAKRHPRAGDGRARGLRGNPNVDAGVVAERDRKPVKKTVP